MQLVKCGCKKGCSGRCSCFTNNIPCTELCGCVEFTCNNKDNPSLELMVDMDDEDWCYVMKCYIKTGNLVNLAQHISGHSSAKLVNALKDNCISFCESSLGILILCTRHCISDHSVIANSGADIAYLCYIIILSGWIIIV